MVQPLFLALSLLPVAFAQDSNVALDIEAIKAHFSNAGLVPSLLATFDPVAAMSVSFPGVGVIQPGQALAMDRKYRSCVSRVRTLLIRVAPPSCRGGTDPDSLHCHRKLQRLPRGHFHSHNGRR